MRRFSPGATANMRGAGMLRESRIVKTAAPDKVGSLKSLSWIPAFLILFFAGEVCRAQSRDGGMAADTRGLDFKQFGLLAIQDGGRRKPIDTFARETLIRITARSTYTDKNGRAGEHTDFILSPLLETHDWKTEPMVLVSLGKLKEQL